MRIVLSAVAAVCCALAAAGPAAAASIPIDLRVEGANGRALTADRYLTDSTKIKTTKQPPNCNGSGATKQLAGRTALGTLVDGALVNPKLDPLLVSDQFAFGLLVCGVGGSNSTGMTNYWLYKVNHVSPEVGGDAFTVKRGDDVLWFFVDGTENSGDELVLTAPARAERDREFTVEVTAYDFAGTAKPVQGALVTGASRDYLTDAQGRAQVKYEYNRTVTLRAILDPHIPAAPAKVCVNDALSKCPAARGGRIWGSRRADRIAGSAGRDTVIAGAGADVIRVRRGNVDRVRCGRGSDTVLAGRRDKVARDCESVRYRGRQ